jgi:hypothetical protein
MVDGHDSLKFTRERPETELHGRIAGLPVLATMVITGPREQYLFGRGGIHWLGVGPACAPGLHLMTFGLTN